MRRIVILSVLAAAGCAGPRPTPESAIVPRAEPHEADVAEIRAVRAASNAAIARRDAAGALAGTLLTYRSLPAGALASYSRDSTYESLARQFADTVALGYVRTPVVIEVSGTARDPGSDHAPPIGSRL